jgi:hypothetical protein
LSSLFFPCSSNVLLDIQLSGPPLAELQHYLVLKNHPAAYNKVLAAVQEIQQLKPLQTPASMPREEPDSNV